MSTLRSVFQLQTIIFLIPIVFLFSRAAADVIACLISVVFLCHCIKTNNWGWIYKPWVIVALSLWLFTVFVVSPLAINSLTSIEIAFPLIRFIIFAVAFAYWILKEPRFQKAFERGVVLVVVFIIIDSIYQYFYGEDILGYTQLWKGRLTGPFPDPVPGTYVARFIFIALAALFFSTKFKSIRTKVIVVTVGIGITIGFLFLTGERAAFLNFMLGSFLILIALFYKFPTTRVLLLTGLALSAIGTTVLARSNPIMKKRTIDSSIEYIVNWPESSNGRIVSSAVEIMINHGNYLTGIGIRNYRSEISKNKSLLKKYRISAPTATHPHNIYVEWLVETGIFGLLGFALMIFFIMKDCLKPFLNEKRLMVSTFAIATLLTTFWPLSHGMSFFTNRHAAIIWITVAWALAFTRRNTLTSSDVNSQPDSHNEQNVT